MQGQVPGPVRRSYCGYGARKCDLNCMFFRRHLGLPPIQTNIKQQFEKSPKSSVIERKIRVTWLAPDANLDEPKGANESVRLYARLCE